MNLLRGVIDTHVHSFPDVIPRKLDDLELVEQARAAGMRALVLKSHVSSTCERAYLLNRVFPDFRVFGGIVLNDTVGGFNPHAVNAALRMGAVQVCMPTQSAANHKQYFGGRDGLTILNGTKLRDQVVTILRLVSDSNAILATGHLSPEESCVLIEEALSAGVQRISVTHPEWGVTAMPVEVQQRLAPLGVVYFERCLVSTQPDLVGHVTFETMVQQIRAVGAETTVIASDYGMPQYPTPLEGMRDFIKRLLEAGFSQEEVRCMARENPAKLLRMV
ncbi:MAG: DUF6282 family protein [Acidobacteria bacterium]|nr:DUF6282 family protein [Acidobacteriota bacterium]MCI0628003.1 DUF6282 family protein [Acidobacteriota bacterium]MCI0722679.1 DUF6282 family protein [Acidobacteriota bacterium]